METRHQILFLHLRGVFSRRSAGAALCVSPTRNSWTVGKVAADGPPPLTAADCSTSRPRTSPSSPFSEELHPFVCKYEQRGKHMLFGDLVGLLL